MAMNNTTISYDGLVNDRVGSLIFQILFFVEAIVIIGINTLTVVAIARAKHLRKHVTNVLIAYVTIADLLSGPAILYNVASALQKNAAPTRIMVFFQEAGAIIPLRLSLATLILIGIDRLVAVWRPLSYSRLITRARAHLSVLVVWGYVAVVNGVPMATGIAKADPVLVQTAQARFTVDRFLYLGVLVPHVYIPIVVSGVLYALIYYLLGKQARKVATLTSGSAESSDANRRKEQQRNRRMVRMLVLVLGSLVVCLCPFSIFSQFNTAYEPRPPRWRSVAFTFSLLLLYTNSWINPLIYSGQSQEWRRAYSDMMCRRCSANTAGQVPSNTGETYFFW